MPRYDKYEPYAGGFRAPLNAAITATDKNKLYAVGLNNAGRVVIGGGQTGIVGVLIAHDARAAGEPVDVMTAGDIVELDTSTFDPGVVYYGQADDGSIDTDNTGARVGFTTVDTNGKLMLVVRMAPVDQVGGA